MYQEREISWNYTDCNVSSKMRENMLNYQGLLTTCCILNIWKKNNLAVQIWEQLSSPAEKTLAVWHELKKDLMKTALLRDTHTYKPAELSSSSLLIKLCLIIHSEFLHYGRVLMRYVYLIWAILWGQWTLLYGKRKSFLLHSFAPHVRMNFLWIVFCSVENLLRTWSTEGMGGNWGSYIT